MAEYVWFSLDATGEIVWIVDKIQPQSNKFATGVENKSTGYLKCNDTLDQLF